MVNAFKTLCELTANEIEKQKISNKRLSEVLSRCIRKNGNEYVFWIFRSKSKHHEDYLVHSESNWTDGYHLDYYEHTDHADHTESSENRHTDHDYSEESNHTDSNAGHEDHNETIYTDKTGS
jgi:hypothetical protein